MQPNQEWPYERVQRLKELWTLGLSCSQIALELNCGITRNAVIGKVHREGLTRAGKPARDPYLRRPPRPRHRGQDAVRRYAVAPPNPKPVALPKPAPPAPAWRGIPFRALRNHSCRFPSAWGPPFLFCGDPTADMKADRPYCPYHHGVTHMRGKDFQPAFFTPAMGHDGTIEITPSDMAG